MVCNCSTLGTCRRETHCLARSADSESGLCRNVCARPLLGMSGSSTLLLYLAATNHLSQQVGNFRFLSLACDPCLDPQVMPQSEHSIGSKTGRMVSEDNAQKKRLNVDSKLRSVSPGSLVYAARENGRNHLKVGSRGLHTVHASQPSGVVVSNRCSVDVWREDCGYDQRHASQIST